MQSIDEEYKNFVFAIENGLPYQTQPTKWEGKRFWFRYRRKFRQSFAELEGAYRKQMIKGIRNLAEEGGRYHALMTRPMDGHRYRMPGVPKGIGSYFASRSSYFLRYAWKQEEKSICIYGILKKSES